MTDNQTSWAIQRQLDQQEARYTGGLSLEEEDAMEAKAMIQCEGCKIPEQTREALERYVYGQVATGSFLRSVLENDFSLAISRADQENFKALKAIAAHVHYCLPGDCHGSKLAVRSWLGEKGAW